MRSLVVLFALLLPVVALAAEPAPKQADPCGADASQIQCAAAVAVSKYVDETQRALGLEVQLQMAQRKIAALEAEIAALRKVEPRTQDRK